MSNKRPREEIVNVLVTTEINHYTGQNLAEWVGWTEIIGIYDKVGILGASLSSVFISLTCLRTQTLV